MSAVLRMQSSLTARLLRFIAVLPLLLFALAVSADPHTFRYAAEPAKSVFLAGEMTGWDSAKRPLTRDTAGVWQTTLDLEPGLWLYKFVVDGRWIADPGNPMSDNDGLGGRHSILMLGQGDWMPAAEAQRGRMLTLDFPSRALGAASKVNLYLPKNHQPRKRYPLLLLLHGYGLDADQWVRTGQIQNFLDHAIARGDIPPMLVLLPSSGKVPYTGSSETHIMEELLPWAQREYGADLRPRRVAVAGMSMGGMGTLNLALRHPKQFGVAVPVSSYLTDDYIASLPEVPRHLRLHMLCGTRDELIGVNRQLASMLKARGVTFRYDEADGGHDFHYWGGITPRMLKTIGDFFEGRGLSFNSDTIAAAELKKKADVAVAGAAVALSAENVAQLRGVWEGEWRVPSLAAKGPGTLEIDAISAERVEGVSHAYRTNDPANENRAYTAGLRIQDGKLLLDGTEPPAEWSLARDADGLILNTRLYLPDLKDHVVSVYRKKP